MVARTGSRGVGRLSSAGAFLVALPLLAQPAGPLTEKEVVARVTTSVDRSLQYLASKQQGDGGWHRNQAVNGLSLLAFLGRGHAPNRGPFRDVIERGKKYMIAHQQPNGYLSFNTMYEHGMATLALAELYGMDPDPKLEDALRKSVDLIVRVQSPSGGWRYNPTPGDQDLSASIMQVVALRAANNAEIPVPAATIEKAIKYVHHCAHPEAGFGYQGPAQGFPTSAAGALCLHLLGQHEDKRITPTLEYLLKAPVKWNGESVQYFFYFHYYAIQAHYQAGGPSWNKWHPKVRELFLEKQNPDGSWDVPPGSSEQNIDPVKAYPTAMATLVLEIYFHFLPAYQR